MARGAYSRVSLDSWGQCAKYLLFIFNLLILIGGLAVAIIGFVAVATDDYYRFQDFEDNNLFRSAAFIQIVVGFLVVLFAFLGCCGAVKESKSLLLTYAVLTLVMFVVLLAGGILAIVYKSDAKEVISKQLHEKMVNYPSEEASRTAWDNLQSQGKCCGIDSYRDWHATLPATFGDAATMFPRSCCKSESSCTTNSAGEAWEQGCVSLVDKVLSFSSTLSWVAIVIGIVMLLGIIFAFCVGCAL